MPETQPETGSLQNWKIPEIPPSTHVDDIELKEGMFIKNIMVIIKLLPDND